MRLRPQPSNKSRGGETEVRDRRLRDISNVVESFTYSLALAVAGQEPDFESTVSRELAQRLRAALRSHLASAERIRPDFGNFARVRIEGDLLDTSRSVRVDVEFDDQSMRELPDGRLRPVAARTVQLGLSVDLEPCQIRQCAVRLKAHAAVGAGTQP